MRLALYGKGKSLAPQQGPSHNISILLVSPSCPDQWAARHARLRMLMIVSNHNVFCDDRKAVTIKASMYRSNTMKGRTGDNEHTVDNGPNEDTPSFPALVNSKRLPSW